MWDPYVGFKWFGFQTPLECRCQWWDNVESVSINIDFEGQCDLISDCLGQCHYTAVASVLYPLLCFRPLQHYTIIGHKPPQPQLLQVSLQLLDTRKARSLSADCQIFRPRSIFFIPEQMKNSPLQFESRWVIDP